MERQVMSRSTDSVQWTGLCPEIRRQILETVCQDRPKGWSSLASVCKEWQHIIAAENLSRLKLRVPCLKGLASIRLQRHFIRHIQFDIELPEYDCGGCVLADHRSTTRAGIAFGNGFCELSRILSVWDEPSSSVTLELNAFSPSDSRHWFKHFHLNSSDTLPETRKTEPQWHDPEHGWFNGRRVSNAPDEAINKVFTPILPILPGLPCTNTVVTSLVIRRHFRRSIRLDGLQMLLQCFVRLDSVVFESPCTEDNLTRQLPTYAKRRFAGEEFLPPRVKNILIFEEFSRDMASVRKLRDCYYQDPGYNNLEKPNWALARKALNLEYLSVSHLTSAEGFFRGCSRSMVFTNLQSLALTSQSMLQPEVADKINHLLEKAAAVALNMPRLHTLVLWSGSEGRASAFIYSSAGRSITWRGTWLHRLTPAVEQAWEKVTRRFLFVGLVAKTERVHGEIKSVADAIFHLNLPCHVVDPASLRQMRIEEAVSTLVLPAPVEQGLHI